jgi:hypothetical protein
MTRTSLRSSGKRATAQIQSWDRTTIAGEFIFDIKPDSALRIDAAQERADSLHLYQLLANDPFVNRFKLVESVIRRHGLDPTHLLKQPDPKQPPDPNISYRFSGTDFLTPALPIILQILEKGGIAIPAGLAQQVMAQMTSGNFYANHVPGDVNRPNTEHGGPAQQVTPLSKHQLDGGGL